jgi:hypothetical protein
MAPSPPLDLKDSDPALAKGPHSFGEGLHLSRGDEGLPEHANFVLNAPRTR